MNRPKLDWGNGVDNIKVYTYLKELEKYCDQLEMVNCYQSDGIDLLTLELEKTKKALKKACVELSANEEVTTLDNSYHKPEDWKEWLMNGD